MCMCCICQPLGDRIVVYIPQSKRELYERVMQVKRKVKYNN